MRGKGAIAAVFTSLMFSAASGSLPAQQIRQIPPDARVRVWSPTSRVGYVAGWFRRADSAALVLDLAVGEQARIPRHAIDSVHVNRGRDLRPARRPMLYGAALGGAAFLVFSARGTERLSGGERRRAMSMAFGIGISLGALVGREVGIAARPERWESIPGSNW